jgi:DNA-binding CsgD family transcriptional regulator
VEETAPGQYQFAHALIRMTLYDELRTGERRRLHRRVGQAIEAMHRRDAETVLPDLARHFHAAGFDDDTERAIDYTTRAGQRADMLLAFEDATGFFQTALDLLERANIDDPRRRSSLLLQLGEAQRKANDFTSALATLLSAAEVARKHHMSVEYAQVVLAYDFTEWQHGLTPGNSSERMLQEALAGLPATEVALHAQLTGRLARAWLHAGSVSEAKALASRAVATARELGDPGALASSLSGLADFAWEPHETEEVLAIASEMLEMAQRAGNLEIIAQAHVRRVVFLLELGNIKRVEAEIAALTRVNARMRQPIFSLFEMSLRATVALLRGELSEAEQLILRATGNQPRSRIHNTDQLSVLIFTLRREQGRLAELRPLVSQFVSQTSLSATWRPGLMLLHVELGDLAAARAVFEDLAADDFASLPRDARWSTCLVYLAEVCAALGDAANAAVLYRYLLPWDGHNVILGGGTGCWGSSGRFLGLLAATMARWTDAERHFADALAMNERMGSAAALAHTRHDFAAMLLARRFSGDRERAAALLRLAQESAETLGLVALAQRIAVRLAPPAGSAATPTAPDDLTARELEVLRLLAIGRGNADVAMVLEISLNTVATHVRNIFAKTGCANRTEAAAYAMRHGLHIGQPVQASPEMMRTGDRPHD